MWIKFVFQIDLVCRAPEKYAKLIETYERELALPLHGMEDTYIELKLLYEKDKVNYAAVDWTRIDEKYHKAKKHLATMLPFEEQLAALDARSHQNRAQIYNKYIDECKDILIEPIVQILYERMIADCCLNGTWPWTKPQSMNPCILIDEWMN